MKHATSRLLFAYWDRLRGERSAPERSEIRPGDIRQILADTFILGTRADGSAAFRLAGTRCAALFGQDLKDTPFAALWPLDREREAASLLDPVLGESSPVVAGLIGVNADGARIALELLVLPLRHNGSATARAIGTLSPSQLPSWIGLVPVTSLELQSLRVVGAVPKPVGPPPPPLAPSGRPRFSVVPGGRTS